MKPTRPINVLGRADWRYRDSKHTSVHDTFARERKRIKEQQECERVAEHERILKVRRIS